MGFISSTIGSIRAGIYSLKHGRNPFKYFGRKIQIDTISKIFDMIKTNILSKLINFAKDFYNPSRILP